MSEPTKPNKPNGYAYVALATTSILWGISWVVGKIAVQHMPGLQVSCIRQLVAGTLFTGFYLIKGEPLPTFKQLRWLAFLSLFTLVFSNGFSTWSLKYVSSGLAALIGALYPLCAVTIELLFLRRKGNTVLTYTGLFIGLAGVAIVLYENAFISQPSGYGLGVVLGLIAMLVWTIGTLLVARNKLNINLYYGLGWQMLMASPILYILARGTHNYVPLATIPAQTWWCIAYLIATGSVICFIAFIYTLKYLPPAIASLYAYVNPIVAMVAGFILLGEPLTVNLLGGAVITVAGVYLVNRSRRKEKPL